MGKINDTLALIGAGARTNKFRVLYPVFGDEIDIICNATSSPGRELGTTEVFVKGRKIQLAGEMADEGTWEMTIYNTPDLLHRRFFLKMIAGIHNFQTPDYIIDTGSISNSELNGGTNLSVSGTANTSSGIADALGQISETVSKINTAYNSVKTTIDSISRTAGDIKAAINGDLVSLETLVGSTGYGRPWYMQEIILQQLNSKDQVSADTILHNAFITNVGPIEYADTEGELSTTTITFAYSGISFGNNSELPSIENYK